MSACVFDDSFHLACAHDSSRLGVMRCVSLRRQRDPVSVMYDVLAHPTLCDCVCLCLRAGITQCMCSERNRFISFFTLFSSFSLFRCEHKVNLRKSRQIPEQSEEAELRQTGNTNSSPEKCQFYITSTSL